MKNIAGSAANIVAIIQARLGSSRLPGKVLLDIEGKPMLWHVVDRLKASKAIGKIVVATSLNAENDAIEKFCAKYGILCFRGSEEDVLDRYYRAANAYKADVVVRITADCPFIDPSVTDGVIIKYISGKDSYDGASNTVVRKFPRGLDSEVISYPILEEIWDAANKRHHREHVTAYIYEHPELYRMLSVESDNDLSYLRWTVDEEADLRLVKEVYKRLYRKGHIFMMDDIIGLLDKEPSLKDINRDVKQKTAGV